MPKSTAPAPKSTSPFASPTTVALPSGAIARSFTAVTTPAPVVVFAHATLAPSAETTVRKSPFVQVVPPPGSNDAPAGVQTPAIATSPVSRGSASEIVFVP